MDNFTNWIPIASLVAIVLFILREASSLINDWVRKKRELKALSIILAEELAHNYFVGQQISSAIDIISNKKEAYLFNEIENNTRSYSFEGLHSGNIKFVCSSPEFHTSFPILEIETKRYERLLPSVVELDAKLFDEVSNVYRRVTSLGQTKDELIHWVEYQTEMDADMLEIKAEYLSESNIEDALKEIEKLHVKLTGKVIPASFKI